MALDPELIEYMKTEHRFTASWVISSYGSWLG
jgi:hypothetical protein